MSVFRNARFYYDVSFPAVMHAAGPANARESGLRRFSKVQDVERRTQWNFFIGEDGLWRWKALNPDGGDVASDRGFETLKECTTDAAQNGYVVWRSESERRREASAS